MNIDIKNPEVQLTDPSQVAQIFRDILATEIWTDQEKEHLWVIGIDTSNRIKYIELVSMGILDQVPAHPREIFRFAIFNAVNQIILIHNHPGYSLTPSIEDNNLTEKIKKSGDILSIKLKDHIIVGKNGHYSYLENGANL